MTAPPMLPATALALAAAVDGAPAQLVSRPSAAVLHVQRAAACRFTPRGAVRRGLRPACGQPARRWHRSSIDGRPLCLRCARVAARWSSTVDGRPAVSLEQLVATLDHARSDSDVSAVLVVASAAGLLGRTVPGPDRPLRLTELIRNTRRRFTHPSVLDQRDRNWADQVLDRPSARYHPRRKR